jgi:glucuronate isomerase
LFHDFAESVPVLDYHCHLSPRLIADDAGFPTITDLWLKGDHYKWRVMRANGVDENNITGSAGDREKFIAWIRALPFAVRNPLYDWSHLEMQRYFGISFETLRDKDPAAIFAQCNEKLCDASFTARNLLRRMNVKVVCTTDDPVDDLAYHIRLKKDGFEIMVHPTFRPDKAMACEEPVSYNRYLKVLSDAARMEISSYSSLLEALDKRHEFFHEHGCRCSDHALETLAPDLPPSSDVESIFTQVRKGTRLNAGQIAQLKAATLVELCRMNHSRGWVQQIHLGVIRNARTRIFQSLGPDAGCDCIGDFSFGRPLARLLDTLDADSRLAKTILFNINPNDNELLACLMGTFQDGSVPGKIQIGPAWWFLDQKDGMTRHLDALSSFGLLSRFIGMTTDSRSLLSYPRHEYFRRILCNLLGGEMERGDLPADLEQIGTMVKNICFKNAQEYFSMHL